MQKDLIFFDKEGLTSTSANFICNLAKEALQSIENELYNLQFYSKEVSLIGGAEKHTLVVGDNNSILSRIKELLVKDVKYKSLIAWLREAIKARKTLEYEIENMSLEDYCALKEKYFPIRPTKEEPKTLDDYIGEMSIKERNEYYKLETECAVLGKYIHPDGQFSNARKSLKQVIKTPHDIKGEGRDAIIYTATPTVSEQEVDALFYALQQEHREKQAAFNAIKHSLELKISEDATRIQEAYNRAIADYSRAREELDNEFSAYKIAKLIEIRNLKIVIPNDLKETKEEVSKLGK